MLVCRKYFVSHHRKIGAIWCYFKRLKHGIMQSETPHAVQYYICHAFCIICIFAEAPLFGLLLE